MQINRSERKHRKNDFRPVKSGRQDSNLRLPGPKPGALAKLSYAPEKSELGSIAGVGDKDKPVGLSRNIIGDSTLPIIARLGRYRAAVMSMALPSDGTRLVSMAMSKRFGCSTFSGRLTSGRKSDRSNLRLPCSRRTYSPIGAQAGRLHGSPSIVTLRRDDHTGGLCCSR